eukprot:14316945-Heterocapsa_arctica.AAC.1
MPSCGRLPPEQRELTRLHCEAKAAKRKADRGDSYISSESDQSTVFSRDVPHCDHPPASSSAASSSSSTAFLMPEPP